MAKKRRFVDLFAGCGGLSLGLEFAGFEPIAFSEISTEAKDTYLLNRPQFPKLREHYYRDAKDLAKQKNSAELLERHGLEKGELDLVCGGPPCQGFSRYGHRRTFTALEKQDIATNHLYVDMAKIVHNLRPKMFLFENVQGLVNARWKGDEASGPGEVFDDVITRFKKETNNEYKLSWRLTRACEFGVPQNRPRVIMVGIDNDVFEKLPRKYQKKNEPPKQTTMFQANQNASEYKAASFNKLYPELTEFPISSPTPHDISEILGDLVDPEYWEYHTNRNRDLPPRDERQKQLSVPATYPEERNDHIYFRHLPHKIRRGWNKLATRKKERLSPGQTAALNLVQSLEQQEEDGLDRVPITGEDEKHFPHASNTYWEMRKETPVANHVYSLHTPSTVKRFEAIVDGRHRNAKEANVAQKAKFSQRRLPETWDGKDPNITITSMPDDFVHYAQPRSLTVRECARLQTFPDWYIFDGKRTTGGRRRAGDYDATNENGEIDTAQLTREVPQYTQVGNAVPVWMARAIGRHLNTLLKESEQNG